jgi:hypothetical protein
VWHTKTIWNQHYGTTTIKNSNNNA